VHVAVLCGGKGTRLGLPIKCLAEVAGRPFMDWKLEQLEGFGAQATLLCGPFFGEFSKRYGNRVTYMPDAQRGVAEAIKGWDGWWTWGDTLLDQPLLGENVCYVVPGSHIAGLWLDAGLYHGEGPWQMQETRARPLTINTPQQLGETGATLRRHGITGRDSGVERTPVGVGLHD
jgi:hypothetical protein